LDEKQRLTSVLPVHVVADDQDQILLWAALGTPTMKPVLRHRIPASHARWEDGNWDLLPGTWRHAELLILIHPSQSRATWVRWSVEREFLGWAVNMQSPLTRTHLDFDHWDHQLDILVKPDRSWSWKDEDELQLVVQLNRMSAQQAKAVREEGQRAVQQIQQNGVPFSDGWEDWQADSTWSLPELGSKWGDLSMYRQSSPQQGQGE
jgi:hypothetical protein